MKDLETLEKHHRSAIKVRQHVRKVPERREERYYFGVVNLGAVCIIRASDFDEAWVKFSEVTKNNHLSDTLQVRPLTCLEFPEYLNFNKKGLVILK